MTDLSVCHLISTTAASALLGIGTVFMSFTPLHSSLHASESGLAKQTSTLVSQQQSSTAPLHRGSGRSTESS